MPQRNYRDRRIPRQDGPRLIIQSHRRNDLNRRKIEKSLESTEFTCLLFIIVIIFISIFLLDYISKGGSQNNEFLLSPQAHSFCVNEFINSVEILGNKIVSMDFLISSRRIPKFYTATRYLLRNSDSFKILEQNLVNNHGEFLKHYYTAHRSYTAIFLKSSKFFKNLEQNIKKILNYNYYKSTPIIIKLNEDSLLMDNNNTKFSNSTNSENIIIKIYHSLFFGKKIELDDFVIINSLKILIDDLMDIQNEIDIALNSTLLLRRYSDLIYYEINLIKYKIEDAINYYEHPFEYPFANLLYMITNFKRFDNKDRDAFEQDLMKINASKKILSDLNLELDNFSKSFSTTREYFDAYHGYLKELLEDMKVIGRKQLDEGEIKRFEKVLIGVKENYEKCSVNLSKLAIKKNN